MNYHKTTNNSLDLNVLFTSEQMSYDKLYNQILSKKIILETTYDEKFKPLHDKKFLCIWNRPLELSAGGIDRIRLDNFDQGLDLLDYRSRTLTSAQAKESYLRAKGYIYVRDSCIETQFQKNLEPCYGLGFNVRFSLDNTKPAKVFGSIDILTYELPFFKEVIEEVSDLTRVKFSVSSRKIKK